MEHPLFREGVGIAALYYSDLHVRPLDQLPASLQLLLVSVLTASSQTASPSSPVMSFRDRSSMRDQNSFTNRCLRWFCSCISERNFYYIMKLKELASGLIATDILDLLINLPFFFCFVKYRLCIIWHPHQVFLSNVSLHALVPCAGWRGRGHNRFCIRVINTQVFKWRTRTYKGKRRRIGI